jgi:hypothetical protein
VINSFTIFSRNETAYLGPSRIYTGVTIARWILAVLLPSVNLKHALFNSQLHENRECVIIFNRYIGTKFSDNELWSSLNKPGVGTQMLIFSLQSIFWLIFLILIENRRRIEQFWRQYREKYTSQSLSEWNDSVGNDDY